MARDSRASMVRSAASLIATRGVSATSFSDVLADSGAPRGSIYYHFPDGKRALVEDAIRWTSERVLAHLQAGETASPRAVMERFVDLWRASVLASGGASGCAVAAVALDTDARGQVLIDAVRTAFRSWSDLLAGQLEAAGVPPDRAMPIALTAVAGMEGALILCRAEGNGEPMEAVAEELLRLLPPETT